jgi:hypothetical protein
MATVIPLQPYRAWRERVRAFEEAIAAALAAGYGRDSGEDAPSPPRLRLVVR